MNILLAGKYFGKNQPLNQNLIKFLKNKKHKIYFVQKKYNIDFLIKKKIELIINSGYGPIISNKVLKKFHHKIVNMHNSYLPNGRGIYPNLWSIFCKYSSGITLCFVDDGIDTGDIIYQKKIRFNKDCTLKISWEKLQNELEKELIKNFHLIYDKKKYKDQNKLKIKSSYHNRKYSEKLFNMLPDGWNSKHSDVQKIGKKFKNSYEKFKKLT